MILYSRFKNKGVKLHNETAKVNPWTQLKEESDLLKQLLKFYDNDPRVLG